MTWAPVSWLGAGDDGLTAFDADVGAHARQLLGVHEAILENGFGDEGDALGLGHQGHELGLQIGGEAGVFLGGDVDGAQSSCRRHGRGRGRAPGSVTSAPACWSLATGRGGARERSR